MKEDILVISDSTSDKYSFFKKTDIFLWNCIFTLLFWYKWFYGERRKKNADKVFRHLLSKFLYYLKNILCSTGFVSETSQFYNLSKQISYSFAKMLHMCTTWNRDL